MAEMVQLADKYSEAAIGNMAHINKHNENLNIQRFKNAVTGWD